MGLEFNEMKVFDIPSLLLAQPLFAAVSLALATLPPSKPCPSLELMSACDTESG